MYLSTPGCSTDANPEKIPGHLLSGHYSFLDYAVACWSIHLQRSASLLREDGKNKELLGESLGVFLDLQWADDATANPLSIQMEERLKSFQTYSFYVQLAQALVAARKQLGPYGKGPSEGEPLNLNRVVAAVRGFQEATVQNSQLREFYGEKWFRCPRLNCVAFYDGYHTASQRDQHISKHERPYNAGTKTAPCLLSATARDRTSRGIYSNYMGSTLARTLCSPRLRRRKRDRVVAHTVAHSAPQPSRGRSVSETTSGRI